MARVPRIQVQAGQSMLEGYVKKPGVGLCELAWNAFDEDATTVEISIETNGLGGIEQIIVEDDGNGMTIERASSSFATVGDSWKRMPGTLSQGKRPCMAGTVVAGMRHSGWGIRCNGGPRQSPWRAASPQSISWVTAATYNT